jgi:hypothetical protein
VRGGEYGGKDAKSGVSPVFPGITSLVITTLVIVSPFW